MYPEGMAKLSRASGTMSSVTSRASVIVCARLLSRSSAGANACRSLNIVPKRASRVRPKTATTSEPRGSPTAWRHRTDPGSARPSAPWPRGRWMTLGRFGPGVGVGVGVGVAGAAAAGPIRPASANAPAAATAPPRKPLRDSRRGPAAASGSPISIGSRGSELPAPLNGQPLMRAPRLGVARAPSRGRGERGAADVAGADADWGRRSPQCKGADLHESYSKSQQVHTMGARGCRRLPLLPAAAAVPVLLPAHLAGRHPERRQLWPLPQAALELGEPREAGERHHVVPEPGGLVLRGQPADHRAEEGDAGRWAEVQDRRPDVLAGQRQR